MTHQQQHDNAARHVGLITVANRFCLINNNIYYVDHCIVPKATKLKVWAQNSSISFVMIYAVMYVSST